MLSLDALNRYASQAKLNENLSNLGFEFSFYNNPKRPLPYHYITILNKETTQQYKFRFNTEKENLEIMPEKEYNPFTNQEALHPVFETLLDFFYYVAKTISAKVFVYRHRLESYTKKNLVFQTFFTTRNFLNLSKEFSHSLRKYDVIGKSDDCFLLELQPNTLPTEFVEKKQLLEISTLFMKLEPTYEHHAIQNKSTISYSYFGHRGRLTLRFDNGFHLSDPEFDVSIPFEDGTFSEEHAVEFLKRVEAKKRMEYVFEPTIFPLEPLHLPLTLAEQIMEQVSKEYKLKELHESSVARKNRILTLYGYHIIYVMDHIFVTLSNWNKEEGILLHTKDSKVLEEFLITKTTNTIKQKIN